MGDCENESKKFSVIVPVYNVAAHLRACIDSLLTQTYCNWEAIFVDDGSDDGSGVVLDELAAQDSRIVVSHQDNFGVSVARNRALEICRGDYVCFLDADDTVEPTWIESYAQHFRETGADLVRNYFSFSNANGKPNGCRILNTVTEMLAWGWKTFTNDGMVWTYAVRGDIARAHQFPRGIVYAEDTIYSLQILPEVKVVCETDSVEYHYRFRADSAMRKRFGSRERKNFLDGFCLIYECCRKHPEYNDVVRRCFSQMYIKGLLGWLHYAADYDCSEEIHQQFRELCAKKIVRIGDVRTFLRPSFWFYLKFRSVHLARFWGDLIDLAVCIKHSLVQDVQNKGGQK